MTSPEAKILAFKAKNDASAADTIAELYAELVAAWPRVEENRQIYPPSDVASPIHIRLRIASR